MNWEERLKVKHRPYYILFFVFFFISPNTSGVEKKEFENRITRLADVEPADLHDSVVAIMPELYNFDQSFSLRMIRKMEGKTRDRNDDANLYCRLFLPAFSPGRELELLDSAYVFAMDKKLDYFLYDYYYNKSYYFRNQSVLDSSMIYILKARDIAKEEDQEIYIQTLHQLGDLYFSVGLYDEAERYYRMIESEGKETGSWKVWRNMVIRNNLALIDIENQDYEVALSKFEETINSRGKLENYSDSLAVGYAWRKIAEIKFLTNNYTKSLKIIKPWYRFFRKYNLEEHLFPSYQLIIRLAIKLDIKEDVEKYFALYNQSLTTINPSPEYQNESDIIASEVYDYLGNESLAYHYFVKYSLRKDSIDSKIYSAGLIQLLAEKNYENLEGNLNQMKSQRIYLLIFILILIFLAFIIYLRSRRISKLNYLLVEANHTKEKLFSIIAHDLKNSFNVILGYSDLLLSGYDDFDRETIKSILTDLKNTGNSTYTLLENLLNWSRSQRGMIDFSPEKILLSDLAPVILNEINTLARKKRIELINKLPSGNTSIYADKNMLTLVFRNLLTNAVKFTNSGGRIYIEMDYDTSSSAVFKIKDEGIGIPSEKAKTLFEIGKSKSSQGTDGEKGTGLGLVLCKEFILKHSGKIWVESELDKGSTFFFTIPLGS